MMEDDNGNPTNPTNPTNPIVPQGQIRPTGIEALRLVVEMTDMEEVSTLQAKVHALERKLHSVAPILSAKKNDLFDVCLRNHHCVLQPNLSNLSTVIKKITFVFERHDDELLYLRIHPHENILTNVIERRTLFRMPEVWQVFGDRLHDPLNIPIETPTYVDASFDLSNLVVHENAAGLFTPTSCEKISDLAENFEIYSSIVFARQAAAEVEMNYQ